MIASLPMYAMPHTAAADTRLWAGIRDKLRQSGIHAPDQLTSGVPDLMSHWRSPDLVLSQTCGLPYRAKLRDAVTLIGTPDYGVKGCPPGYYRSLIVARSDDPKDDILAFRNCLFAYNDPLSQSGWAAVVSEAPWLVQGPTVHTGSHLGSVRAVREGAADLAAIDAVTFRHLTAAHETTGLRIIHETRPTPGLPYIAAHGADQQTTLACVQAALADLSTADRAILGLCGAVALSPDTYDLPIPPAPGVVRM